MRIYLVKLEMLLVQLKMSISGWMIIGLAINPDAMLLHMIK